MPGQISKNYASPGLRHGLLLEDHPGVEVVFNLKKGTDIGVPDEFGGSGNFCVATIKFPPSSGRSDVIGFKAVPSKGSPDEWGVLCTKTLGRALKRAGYPDDTVDLRALVHWRQREAEIRAIDSGTANLQLNAAPLEEAIAAAGTTESSVSVDDGEAPDTESDDDITDAELIDEGDDIVDEAKLLAMRQELGKLDKEKQTEVRAWARKQGIVISRADLTHGQVDKVVDFLNKINDVAENGHGDDQAAEIAELVAGLDDTEAKTFRKFCKDQGIDPAMAENAPGSLTADQQESLLGWLEPPE